MKLGVASYSLRKFSRAQAIEYVTKLYKQVPVLDSGARGAAVTFVQRGMGDVHLAWENEARLEVREAAGDLDLVYPPISIRAEPHVALVDASVDRKKTRAPAEAYFEPLTWAMRGMGASRTAADYLRAVGYLQLFSRQVAGLMAGCDAWLMPVLAEPPLEERAIHHGRGRIVRERDDEHLRLRPGARDRHLEVGDQVGIGRERHVAQVAARDDHRVLVDRIRGIGT